MILLFNATPLLYVFALFFLGILGLVAEYIGVLTTIYWVLFWIVTVITAVAAVLSPKKWGYKIVDIVFTVIAIIIAYICSEDIVTSLREAAEVNIFEFILTLFGAYLVHEIMILPVSYTVAQLITEEQNYGWNMVKAIAAIALSVAIMLW